MRPFFHIPTFAAVCLLSLGLVPGAHAGEEADRTETLQGFSFTLIDTNGQKSYVKGTRAALLSESTMQMTDVASFIYQNGVCKLLMNTPQARADLSRGLVETDQPVQFRNVDGMTVTGTGMVWDTKKRSLLLKSGTTTNIPPNVRPKPAS